MSDYNRAVLFNCNRLLVLALSIGGLVIDGVRPADALIVAGIVIWLWMDMWIKFEIKTSYAAVCFIAAYLRRRNASDRRKQRVATAWYAGAALLLLFAPPGAFAKPLRDAFKAVNSAVVEIRTARRSYSNEGNFIVPAVTGLGSGVLISPTTVLTASHVVEIADQIVVTFIDGQERIATVLSSEPYADVSLLSFTEPVSHLDPARLGDSDDVHVGEQVFVVGAPYGLSHTLTVGVISGKHLPPTTEDFSAVELLQTDAAINPGSSGGPMFNFDAEVIGIVSHIWSKSGGFEGLGFAVSVNTAKMLVVGEQSFWTGFQGILLPSRLAEALNVPQSTGMLVQRVAQGSPADAIGLRSGHVLIDYQGRQLLVGGDVILAVNKVPIDSPRSIQLLRRSLSAAWSDEPLVIDVLRGGRREQLSSFEMPSTAVQGTP